MKTSPASDIHLPVPVGHALDHVGIAVHALESVTQLYTRLLGAKPYKEEAVPAAGVRVVFFQCGASKIELLAPLSEASPLHRFLLRRGPGLHHVAFGVEDLRTACAALKAQGFEPLTDAPQPGADNKEVCFFHPRTTGGVLVELCQSRDTAPLAIP